MAKTTYVLVHGAFSGTHSCREVRHLVASGVQISTPSLTNLSEPAHPVNHGVNLTTHSGCR